MPNEHKEPSDFDGVVKAFVGLCVLFGMIGIIVLTSFYRLPQVPAAIAAAH